MKFIFIIGLTISVSAQSPKLSVETYNGLVQRQYAYRPKFDGPTVVVFGGNSNNMAGPWEWPRDSTYNTLWSNHGRTIYGRSVKRILPIITERYATTVGRRGNMVYQNIHRYRANK